jgi:protein-disulfide isomerase
MKRFLLVAVLLTTADGLLAQTGQDTPPAKAPRPPAVTHPVIAAPIQKNVEAYLRKIYAWGPTFQVKVGLPVDAPVPGFYEVSVQVIMGDQSDTAAVYVSKDGRYLFRGEIQDMTTDPLAAVRSQIHLADSPSKGPANALVVLVEFADFQCPTCRELHKVLREIEPNYPQVRFIFKDFPLSQIHPWAMTAAVAGRCAYQQNHAAFWKMHDAIFDSQDLISAENAYQKMLEFAAQAGLDSDAFRACMANPEIAQALTHSVKEAQALKIANTPTVFINGRRLIGADRALLEQYIQFELATPSESNKK